MPRHTLTNFEIQKYYQNEPYFNGVYSRNKLPKIKDGTYVVNPIEFKSIENHWITLYVNAKNLTYSGSKIISFSIQIYFLLIDINNNKIILKYFQ